MRMILFGKTFKCFSVVHNSSLQKGRGYQGNSAMKNNADKISYLQLPPEYILSRSNEEFPHFFIP